MRLGVAALLLCFSADAGAAATIPADQVPPSKLGVAPDWNDIPNISFECEGGTSLVVSHKTKSITRNGVLLGKLFRSDAVYQSPKAHRFVEELVMFISILSGPNWLLEEYGASGRWLFYDHGVFVTCALNR